MTDWPDLHGLFLQPKRDPNPLPAWAVAYDPEYLTDVYYDAMATDLLRPIPHTPCQCSHCKAVDTHWRDDPA